MVPSRFLVDGDNLAATLLHGAKTRFPGRQTDFLSQRIEAFVSAQLRAYRTAAEVMLALSDPPFDGRLATQIRQLPATLSGVRVVTGSSGNIVLHRLLVDRASLPTVVFSANKRWLGYVSDTVHVRLPGVHVDITPTNFTALAGLPAGITHQNAALFRCLVGSSTCPGLPNCGASTASKVLRELAQAGLQLRGPGQPWDEIAAGLEVARLTVAHELLSDIARIQARFLAWYPAP